MSTAIGIGLLGLGATIGLGLSAYGLSIQAGRQPETVNQHFFKFMMLVGMIDGAWILGVLAILMAGYI